MAMLLPRTRSFFHKTTIRCQCIQLLRLSSSSPTNNDSDSSNRVSLQHQSSPKEDTSTQQQQQQHPQSTTTAALLSLSKARLSALVVTTTSLGFLSAGPLPLLASPATLGCVTLGTALCSASAATFNQILEVEKDAKMKRTRGRVLIPKSSGSSNSNNQKTQILSHSTAMVWGITTGMAGTAILGMGTDPITMILGGGNIVLYSGVYTWMKGRSEWNTWVGAVVGAVPPVMGYSAATGGMITEAESLFLGATLFLWQFPHFFALNWMYREDYKRGGFAMVATSDPTGSRTSDLITRYTLYLSTLPLLSSLTQITSPMFAIEGIALNAYAWHVARKFEQDKSNANARKVFLTSLWYLPSLLMLFLLHSRKWHEDTTSIEEDEEMMENASPFLWVKDSVRGIQNKGRELCLHEAIASKDVWIGEGENKTALDESKCPISLKRSLNVEERRSDGEKIVLEEKRDAAVER